MCLFQNLLADITRHSEEEVVTHASVEASCSSKDTGDYSSSSSCAWKRSVAVPCSGFEDLWVKKEKGEGTCLFVDTGVYTRNRVFRMFGSSKHTPKNAPDKPVLTLCKFGKEWYRFKEAKIEANESRSGRLSVEIEDPNSPRPLVNKRDRTRRFTGSV